MLRFIEIETPDDERFRNSEIISIEVLVGERVNAGDAIFIVQKDSETHELPAPYDGRVAEFIAHQGDRISTRTPLLLLETEVDESGSVTEEPDAKATLETEDSVNTALEIESKSNPAPEKESKPRQDSKSKGTKKAIKDKNASPKMEQKQLDIAEVSDTVSIDLKVPDIGGAEDVEVIEILVAVGDNVSIEAPLVTLETDKASMDVPASQAGKIVEILVNSGDKVSEGTVIVRLATSGIENETPQVEASSVEVEEQSMPPTETKIESAPPPTVGNNQELITVSVPDIGGDSDVDIIEILVNVGDTVALEDGLITLETDKASMDVPSSASGVVNEILVKVGDTVSQGSAIILLQSEKLDTPQQAADDVEPIEVVEVVVDDKNKTTASTTAESEPGVTSEASLIRVSVPDMGGPGDVDVIEVLVNIGDSISPEDGLITLETDKATMDVPSPEGGVITEILVSAGDKVSEGTEIIVLSSTGNSKENLIDNESTDLQKEAAKPAAAPNLTSKTVASKAPAEKSAMSPTATISEGHNKSPHANPSVRKFARELGVDVTALTGSGRKGRITKEDVQKFVKGLIQGGGLSANASANIATGTGIPPIPAFDFSQFGDTELSPLSKIKRLTAENLHRSWVNIPHVTYNDVIDITKLERFRGEMKAELAEQGIRITPLAFQMKALASALRAFPTFNSSLEPGGQNLILKKYFNIGIAVDTPAGLMVPVVKDVDKKGIADLGKELGEMAQRARDRKLKPIEMQGASMTISSLGALGGTSFTPIINPPEVAILGVTRSEMRPVWDGNEFVPKLMLPVSLAFDHRVIDGAEAARFVNYLAAKLSDIRRLML